jgi:hypothetical protein
MATKFMQAYVGNAHYRGNKLVSAVANHQASFKEVLELCRCHRVMAIGCLLMFGDAASFQARLYRSGRAYLHALARLDEASKVTSRGKPFFDAIAARDLDGARDIAALSRETRDEVEYEEDFLFVHFLMTRFFLHQSDADDEAILTRWEEVLDGADDPRLAVCKALFAKDTKAFNGALELHLAEVESRLRRLEERDAIAAEELATEGKVSVEALALVVLAELAGIKPKKNYLFVPSLARAKSAPPAAPDSWLSMD